MARGERTQATRRKLNLTLLAYLNIALAHVRSSHSGRLVDSAV